MYLEVKVTFPSLEEAKKVASEIIENKLAACAQIHAIESIYHWNGIINDAEFLVTFKTIESNFEYIKEMTLNMHSYEVPEIIAIPILQGNQTYLNWIEEHSSK